MKKDAWLASARSIQLLSRISRAICWKPTGKLQQTLQSGFSRSGICLHSGKHTTVNVYPAKAGEGRFFISANRRIPAAANCISTSPLCTMLSRDGATVKMVEHILSAFEAMGVDNCAIEITGGMEVPVMDGSANKWVDAINEVGLCNAEDSTGSATEKMAPFIVEPLYLWRNNSFIAAFPSAISQVTYGIDFPQAPAIGCQWFSCFPLQASVYVEEIASARTFCIYEEVENLRATGLIRGGSLENALVCSTKTGWVNPPLRFQTEACRHKILDLIGDLSLFAHGGSQGLPVAHIMIYKGGHSLHAEFMQSLLSTMTSVQSV